MPNALSTTKSGFIVGKAFMAAGRSLAQNVHDGDTVAISPNSYLSTRFLGVDTPEVSFTLLTDGGFPSIKSSAWDVFLNDPFRKGLPPFKPALGSALKAHLKRVTGQGCAANHAKHASAATDALRDLIQADIDAVAPAELGLFMAFGRDVLDRYGRFLCYLHRDDKASQPRAYNVMMIESGLATPYFIWPNIKPFLKDAVVPKPGKAITNADLDTARAAVAEARTNRVGIFDTVDPLRLMPFELRFLARATSGPIPTRPGPDRWVIDLSHKSKELLPPNR